MPDDGKASCPYCTWRGPESWLDIHLRDCDSNPDK